METAEEAVNQRLSRHPREKRWLPTLALLAVLAVAFLLRASAYDLPAFQRWEQSYMRDETGEPYLTEMDSYFYLRKAQEMAERGEIVWAADRIQDPMMGQRVYDQSEGVSIPLGLPVLAYWLWKNLLSHLGMSLTQTAIWMGPVLGSLAVIPAFCYVRRRTSLPGALAAGLLAGCAIPFVVHTHAGFFDTDMLLALLPMTALLAQMRCMQEEGWKRQLGYACLSGAAFVLMSLCWRAYYGYVLLAVGCTALSLLLLEGLAALFPGRLPGKRLRPALRGGLLSLLLTVALLLLTGGTETLRQLLGAFGAYRAARGSTDAMPYALQFVSEMQKLSFLPGGSLPELMKANLRSVLGRLGGLIPCALALLYLPLRGILFCRGQRDTRERQPAEDGVAWAVETGFLSLWTAAGVYLAYTGARFAELAVLPLSLLCGLMTGSLFSLSGGIEQRRRRAVAGLLCAGLTVSAVFPVCYGSWRALRQTGPLVTDSKSEAMTYLREETPENTAIVSWWDDGYYMEYQARRRTLSDGGTDSGAMNWFLAKALLTDDPELMARIFWMLNESGTDALDALTEQGMEQARAAKLLLQLLRLDRAEAEETLRALELPLGLLDKTHPAEGTPLVLTLSTDLLAKYRSLGYFGYWDPETLAQEGTAFTMSSSRSAVMEDGRAELPMSNAGYTVLLQEDRDGRLTAEYRERGEACTPCRLCVWENGKRIQDEGRENDHLALVVVKEGERCCALLCSEALCDSMLVRLLVCEDESVACFRRLGTWYGEQESEPCAAQRRICYATRSAWATQIWQLCLPAGQIA